MPALHLTLVGASGYTGQEALALLRRHPHVRRLDTPPSAQGLHGIAADADLVLLATPAETAAEYAGELIARGQRVLDLSGAHRCGTPAVHAQAYGFAHPHPDVLAQAVPGFAAQDLMAAAIVANPGCYANGMLSALMPLHRAGLLAADAVADVVGLSGISGAGRKASERTMFMTVTENLTPYKTLREHQHIAEVERLVPVRLLFAPVVAPLRQGMLVIGTVQVHGDDLPQRLQALDLPGDPFWRRVAEVPDVHAVVRTGRALVHYVFDPPSGRVQFTCALDNLLRGAASHAVWNLNRMFGLPELAGLDAVQ